MCNINCIVSINLFCTSCRQKLEIQGNEGIEFLNTGHEIVMDNYTCTPNKAMHNEWLKELSYVYVGLENSKLFDMYRIRKKLEDRSKERYMYNILRNFEPTIVELQFGNSLYWK